MLLASLVYWIVAEKQSALMVGASLSLIGLGAYSKQVQALNTVVADAASVEGPHE
jgi:hypothetical protein